MQQNNYQIPEKRHSRLGIASVVVGFGLPVLLVLFVLVIYLLESNKSPWANDIEQNLFIVSLLFPLVHLIALILALVGLFSKQTKNLFPIIGLVLNLILMIVGIILLVAGVSVILLLLSVPVPVR
ncbi:MAG: hypothetical protein ABJA66_21450 [Actinomycetota bacterium]